MDEQERQELNLAEEEEFQDLELNLEDILKEFSAPGEDEAEQMQPAEADAQETSQVPSQPEAPGDDDTVRIDIPQSRHVQADMGDTVRIDAEKIRQASDNMGDTVRIDAGKIREAAKAHDRDAAVRESAHGQPIGEYVPPQPIIFQPRAKLRELKRKLVAGPEKRYYELNEQGVGKLQLAILLSLLVVAFAGGATAMYAMGMVQPDRMRLMIFVQFVAMLMSAALGCYQLMEGLGDLFRGRFTLNTLLVFTFISCCADGVLCLRDLRIPCCAAFCLQITMSLWATYHRRTIETGQMDTLRKANHLDGIFSQPDFYESFPGLLRGEGRLEDFMDYYREPSTAERVMSWYAVAALLISIAAGVIAGVLHNSVEFGVQVVSVSLMASVPVTAFIAQTRPMAILEKRLHAVGTVLCGWRGIKALSRRAAFPLTHEDLFPIGSCKLNGVKFYGSRNPDEVVAYSTALIEANGGGLVPLFRHLLESRNGRHYRVENLRTYDNGGIGGEVLGEPVLVGVLSFLKEMGVEIPEGIRVNQAVYVAIDGELCGLFAVTYNKVRSSAAGIGTLCAYRSLHPVMMTEDFMLTEGFIRSKFSVNTRRISFPERSVRQELAAAEPDPEAPTLALITREGLAPFAYAVTGARSVRTAGNVAAAINILGGIVGLGIMLSLAVLGARELLTPANVLLYELAWMIPGLLVTEWTRSV